MHVVHVRASTRHSTELPEYKQADVTPPPFVHFDQRTLNPPEPKEKKRKAFLCLTPNINYTSDPQRRRRRRFGSDL